MTTATFWRPSGKNLNKASTAGRDEEEWGVTPDKGFTVEAHQEGAGRSARCHREAEIIPDRAGRAAPRASSSDRQLDMALQLSPQPDQDRRERHHEEGELTAMQ